MIALHLLLDYTKTFFKDLLLPPSGPLLLAGLGALCLRWRPRLGRTLIATGVLVLWLLSTPLVADQLARWSEHYGALDISRAPHAEALVILGGGGQRDYAPEYGGPAANPYLLERLTYGAYLAHRLELPVLVTGFRIEAVAMRASLQRNFGIEPRWVDRDAYDTFDNARDSARLLAAAGVHRVILVTSAAHMWRAAHEFAATGLQVEPAPVGLMPPRHRPMTPPAFIPDSLALTRSTQVVYEWLGERSRELFAATGLRRQQPQQWQQPTQARRE